MRKFSAMTYPNWKNEGEYDFVEKLSYLDWAWEFLRRSKDYRVAYDEFAEEAQELEEKFGPDWKNEYECRVYDL